MNKEPLTIEVAKAIKDYLTFLQKKSIPSRIANAIESVRDQYETTGCISPTQIAFLQRCFLRATTKHYEVDWLPVGILDQAIAEELDGQTCQMLTASEIALAIRWLSTTASLSKELETWHAQLEEQLLLTGWLSADQLARLKERYLAVTGRAVPARQPQREAVYP